MGKDIGARDLRGKLPKKPLRRLRIAHLGTEPGLRFDIHLEREGERLVDISLPFALISEHLFESGEAVESFPGLAEVANGANLGGERELDFLADRILRNVVEGIDACQIGLAIRLNEARHPMTWETHLAELASHAEEGERDVSALLDAIDAGSDEEQIVHGGVTLSAFRRPALKVEAKPRRKSDVGAVRGSSLAQEGHLVLPAEPSGV